MTATPKPRGRNGGRKPGTPRSAGSGRKPKGGSRVSYRFSAATMAGIKALQLKHGATATGVLEMLVAEAAKWSGDA